MSSVVFTFNNLHCMRGVILGSVHVLVKENYVFSCIHIQQPALYAWCDSGQRACVSEGELCLQLYSYYEDFRVLTLTSSIP